MPKKKCEHQTKSCTVLLATYNGEKYIAEQLESIAASLKHWGGAARVVVSDNGSTDRTYEICSDCAPLFEDMSILCFSSARGSSQNFEYLLQYAKENTWADYYFLADQDDIWCVEKVVKMIGYAELNCPRNNKPLCIVSDAFLYRDGQILNETHLEFLKFPNFALSFVEIFFSNYAQGAAMIMNRTLLEMSQPGFSTSMPHDHYLALLATDQNGLLFMRDCLIKYRIHECNAIGIHRGLFLRIRRVHLGFLTQERNRIGKMAGYLSRHRGLSKDAQSFIRGLCERKSWWRRRLAAIGWSLNGVRVFKRIFLLVVW